MEVERYVNSDVGNAPKGLGENYNICSGASASFWHPSAR